MADGANLIIGSDADPLWTQNNRSDARTQLVRDGTVTRNALLITNLNGPGMRAIGSNSQTGVRGSSTTGAGVLGDATTGIGVQGGARVPGASTGGVGVQGNTPYGAGVEGNATAGAGVFGQSSTGLGVEGDSLSGDGVWGISTKGTGVYGESINGSGVEGYAPLKPGVRGGSQDGAGVLGDSDRGPGVYGIGRSNSQSGVAGRSTAADGVGTRGDAPFLGVLGVSTNTTSGRTVAGVLGEADSDTGVGVQGQSKGSMGIGVQGLTKTGFGVVGGAVTGSAGAFFGNVVVTGDFIVFGRKAAAVPFPDGSHQLLYCVESPESCFEDFGTAKLVRGRAKVNLDRRFAAVVRRGQLHVFLTPEGECRGLFVSRQSGSGFEVRELQGGTATVRFSYRVVGRRKDVTAKRFERVTLPKLPKGVGVPIKSPEPLELPKPPERARSRVRKRGMIRGRRRAGASRPRR